MRVHATTIAIAGRGVMLRGPSGCGKSDLALRLIEQAGTGLGTVDLKATLVADDQTELYVQSGVVWASCPETIRGKIEIRGLGILAASPHLPVPLALVVDLQPAASIERMPEAADMRTDIMGHNVPRIWVDAAQHSAASVVRAAFLSLC